jgi:hypothetical protein
MARSITLFLIIFYSCVCYGYVKPPVINTNKKVLKHLTPQQVCRNFLLWYIANRSKLKHNYFGPIGDSTKLYKVNFDSVGIFLKQLKSCGYVSENYVGQFGRLFYNTNQNLTLHPQYDGPVEGFEQDIVLGIMEEDDITKNMSTLKRLYIITSNNRALLIFNISDHLKLIFTLSKYKIHHNKWLIEDFRQVYI